MSSDRRDYLELRASMGVLTDAEREELERLRADRSIVYVNSSGVIVYTQREYTVAEWKELVARSRGHTGPLLPPEEPKSE
jgi:hypothetical protein